MSILIKGLNKPKNCRVCDFNRYDCYCKINHGSIDRDFWDCDKTCPIVEVPAPHGDLIDRNALQCEVDDIGLGYYEVLGVTEDTIDNTPTVIEAEG